MGEIKTSLFLFRDIKNPQREKEEELSAGNPVKPDLVGLGEKIGGVGRIRTAA